MKRRGKIRLGKYTEEGFKYFSGLRFNKSLDLEEQMGLFLKERKIKRELKKEILNLHKETQKFKSDKKGNNLSYYYALGKKLQFLDKPSFNEVEKWSAFRVIYESLREILPHISNSELGSKHIAMMFYIGKVDRKDLAKATWIQWYEIAKFPKLFKGNKFFKKILPLISHKKISGPQLRLIINNLIKKEKP